jgi:hypothetical protein
VFQPVDLRNDVEALKSLVMKRSTALEVAEGLVIAQKVELEKLPFQIACLKRIKFGRPSEQLDAHFTQMQPTLEDLEASLAQMPGHVQPAAKWPLDKPVCRALSDHLPCEEIVNNAMQLSRLRRDSCVHSATRKRDD